MTTVRRTTTETDVTVELAIGSATPTAKVSTGDGFLDHMVGTLARYAGLDLSLTATGDLPHHLVEDVSLALGRALREVTPATCARYGAATVPMDDALVTVAVDLGGRGTGAGPSLTPSTTTCSGASSPRQGRRATWSSCGAPTATTCSRPR